MAGGASQEKPISLFFSYSHKDEALRDELGDHLVPLERAGLIEVWHDREMLPGDNVDDEIAEKLKTADVILVLVSPSFIRSKYCTDIEFKNAIERHKKGKARVVPVILRPCQWQVTPLKDLLAMPTDGKAVTQWPNQDAAFNDVADGVRRLATAVQEKGITAAKPAAAGAKPAVGQRPQEPRDDEPLKVEPAPIAEPDLERRTDDAPRNWGIADLSVFRDIDAPWCPEMVALPAGEFLMGSPETEEGRYGDEGPQHQVTIAYRFALGRYPLTVGEYRRFVEASGHHHEGGMYFWTGAEWKQDEAKSWRSLDSRRRIVIPWSASVGGMPWRTLNGSGGRRESPTGYLRKRNGNMRRVPGRQPAMHLGTRSPLRTRTTGKASSARPPRLAPIRRTPGDSATCTATSGSGSRTSGMTATRMRP